MVLNLLKYPGEEEVMKHIIIIFTLFISVFAAERTRIAVLDLQAKSGIDPNLAATLTDLIGSELVGLKRFDVVDRANMDALMAEQSLQNSGCTDSACAVQLGNMLNVEKMVVGSVAKLGESFIITVNFVDVELSQVTLSEKITAKSQDELLSAVQKLALNIGESVQLNGRIVQMGDKILVNLGSGDGVALGQRLQVIRYGAPIIDEDTGELLGRDVTELGFAVIKSFNGSRLSVVEPERGAQAFEKGDRVIVVEGQTQVQQVATVSDNEDRSGSGNRGKKFLAWSGGILTIAGGGLYAMHNTVGYDKNVAPKLEAYESYDPGGPPSPVTDEEAERLRSDYEEAYGDYQSGNVLFAGIGGTGLLLLTIASLLPDSPSTAWQAEVLQDSVAMSFQKEF